MQQEGEGKRWGGGFGGGHPGRGPSDPPREDHSSTRPGCRQLYQDRVGCTAGTPVFAIPSPLPRRLLQDR